MTHSLVNAPMQQTLAVTAASEEAAPALRREMLFVLSCLAMGGSERKIARMANRFKADGLPVGLVLVNGPYTLESTLRRDLPLHKLERRGRLSFKALWKLRRLIRRQRPATVVAVNLYQALYVACATFLMRNRPRTVALVNTSTFRGRPGFKQFYQAVLGRFDHTVHGSRMQMKFWNAPQDDVRCSVIYNGVDSATFEPTQAFEAAKRLREKLGLKPSTLLMGTVGAMRPEKNQPVLIDTLRRLRAARVDAHLAIAGDGPMRDLLHRRAGELEVADRVHFIGEVDDVRPLLGALDVFVLPSIAVESFSNAALEAMAMAIPVILSDIGGAREMIDDGVEGHVISVAELPARLPALISALHAEPRRRRQMGQAARARVVSRFSIAAMTDAYRRLIGAPRGERPGTSA